MMYDQLERNVKENITRCDIDLILFRSILISIEQNGLYTITITMERFLGNSSWKRMKSQSVFRQEDFTHTSEN